MLAFTAEAQQTNAQEQTQQELFARLKETQRYIYWNDSVGHADQKYYLYLDDHTNRFYIKRNGEFLLIPNLNNYCVGYDWFKEP